MEGPTAIVVLLTALLQSVFSQSCSREEYNSMQLDFTNCTGSVFEYLEYSQKAGIFKKSMGARHRGGIGLSYRPARLHRLAELMPWNRFLGSLNV
jgi:hypothetical protein